MPPTTITVPIDGMTCRSCELRVARALRALPGVTTVRVSARTGSARITAAPAPDAATVRRAVQKAGYRLARPARAPWLTSDARIWREVLLGGVIVAAVLLLASRTGLTELSSRLGNAATAGSLLVVALLGLAAGFSTCMVLVGGLVLAVTARFAERHPDLEGGARLRPVLAFLVGRVLGFTVLGAGLGLVGSVLKLGTGFTVAAMAVAGVVMLLLGLQLTGVSPRLHGGLLPTLPAALTARLHADPGAGGSGTAVYRDGRAVALGAVTFFLPCGFTQAVQAYALTTGSPARAAALLGVFALGTAPGLALVGGAAGAAASRPRLLRFAGVAAVAFALVTLGGAANVVAPGWYAPWSSPAPTALSSNVHLEGGVQVMTMTQDAGYTPGDSVVYAGIPVRWQITSNSFGCDRYLIAPKLGVTKPLQSGANSFEFTLAKPGRVDFSCEMGMYQGSVTAIPAPGSGPAGNARAAGS